MSTNKVYGDGPNRIPLVEQETRWDYADPQYARWHPGDVLDRPEPAQPVRREQGRGRRDGAGIRPLLRHADVLPARRLPDGTESQRRRAARFPQLSRAVQSRGARVHGSSATRASRSATTSTASTWPASSTRSPTRRAVGEVYNLGGGKANSCSILEAFALVEQHVGPAAAVHATSRRTGSAITSATTATCARCGTTIPAGTSRSASSRRSRRSSRPGSRSSSREDSRHRRLRVRRVDADSPVGRAGHAIEVVGLDNFVRPGSEQNRARASRARRRRSVTPTSGSRPTSRRCRPSTSVVDAAANPSVLAGVDGQTSSRQLVEHNLLGTVNVLEYCRRHQRGARHAEHQPRVLDCRRWPGCRSAS